MANQNLGPIQNNIVLSGDPSEAVTYTDFGGNDTYSLTNGLQGDVTVTDNNGGGRVNLPVGFEPDSVQFADNGVQFTIGGNTVTILTNDVSSLTFVVGGSPLDPSVGTETDLAGLASAYGTSVPDDGLGNTVSNPGAVQSDDTIGDGSDDGDDGDDADDGDDDNGGDDGFATNDNLTENTDVLVGDGNNNLFRAPTGTLTPGDSIDGKGGDDLLELTLNNGDAPGVVPNLKDVETIEVESRNDGDGDLTNTLNLGNAVGLDDVVVVDKGVNSADLTLTGLEPNSPTVTLSGDETINLEVEDDTTASDQVVTAVDAFQGTLNLANAIENVNLDASAGTPNNFALTQDPSANNAFESLTVTGSESTTITSFVNSKYDYSQSTAGHTLVLAENEKFPDNPDDQVKITGSDFNDKFDFTTTMDGVGEDGHPNIVDGGGGQDQVWIELDEPIEVQPEIENVEAIKLQFNVGKSQDATFSARDVSPFEEDEGPGPAAIGTLQNGEEMNPVYIIEESTSQVQVLDLATPAFVEIIGDLKEGAIFDSSEDSEITTRFVTNSQEDPSIIVEGDLEYQDFDNVTIVNEESPEFPNPPQGDGQGEVGIKNQILLNEASSLTIGTSEEDDDDADNDGDIVVAGLDPTRSKKDRQESYDDEERPDHKPESYDPGKDKRKKTDTDTAIDDSANLADLTVNAVNGNVFLADGGTRFEDRNEDQVKSDDDALDDATSLKNLTVNADNAIASIGDIGEYEAATDLEFVNLTGTNRGVLNLDDIIAATKGHKHGDVKYDSSAPEKHPYKDGSGARIEDFNVTTAERSVTDIDFDVNGQPIEVANDIDKLAAGLVRNMDLNIAKDGSLSFGPIKTNITELNIFGDGDLFMFGAQGPHSHYEQKDAENHKHGKYGEHNHGDDGKGGNDGHEHKKYKTPFYVEDIQATNHDGDIMLDFRTFTGKDQDFGSTDFEGTTNIVLGDQDTTGVGIRFDSYKADIDVHAGAGDMIGEDNRAKDDKNRELPKDVEADYKKRYFDADAKYIVGGVEVGKKTGFDKAYYGLVTGKGDDKVTVNGGKDYVHTGKGHDTIDLGDGADIAKPAQGIDVVDLGSEEGLEKGDGDADVHILGSKVLNGFGETPEDSFDLVRNFEEGSGADVTRLVKPGFGAEVDDDASGHKKYYADPVDADMPEISAPNEIAASSDVDIFELLPAFGTVNLDGAIQDQNPNGEETVEKNFFSMLETKNAVDDYSSYLEEHPEGVFSLVYDNDGPNVNAGLFHISSPYIIEKGVSEDTAAFGRTPDIGAQWVTPDGTPLLSVRNDSDETETFTWEHQNSNASGEFDVPANGWYFVPESGIPEQGSTRFFNESGQQIGQGTLDLSETEVRQIEEMNVELVSVYEDVGAGEMEADDFQFVGVNNNLDEMIV